MGTKNGSCLCGAVTFSATPTTQEVAACHCSMCRKMAAGPFFATECTDLIFADENALGLYHASEWGERVFCPKCGSVLMWRLRSGEGTSHISVNAFDDFGEVKFSTEVFIDEKPDYYSFEQQTTQMTGPEVFAYFAANQDEK